MDDNPETREQKKNNTWKSLDAFILSSQITAQQLRLLSGMRYRSRLECFKNPDYLLNAMTSSLSVQNRCKLLSCGGLKLILLRNLFLNNGHFSIKYRLMPAMCVLSRSNTLPKLTCERIMMSSSSVLSVAFHPTHDNILATAGDDKTVMLTDIRSELSNPMLHGHNVYSVVFNSTGTFMATGGVCDTNSISLFQVSRDGQKSFRIATLEGHGRSGVTSVAFHQDGKLLASGGYDKTVILWQVSKLSRLAILAGHSKTVTSVAFHPAGQLLVSGSKDSTVIVWKLSSDHTSATQVDSLKMIENGGVSCVAFHQTENILAIGCLDGKTHLYKISPNGLNANQVATLVGHKDTIKCVQFHRHNSILATASMDKTVKLWFVSSNGLTAICMATLEGNRHGISSVAFHPNDRSLVIGSGE